VQGLSKPEDVPTSTGIMFSESYLLGFVFCQILFFSLTQTPVTQSGSAAYFIVVAQSIFANRMLRTIQSTAPNLNAFQVLGTGVSDIYNIYSGTDLAAVLNAYMVGIKDVFICSLAGSVLAVLLAMIIPFQKLPNHDSKKTEEKVGTL
jgi:hypothetical protein